MQLASRYSTGALDDIQRATDLAYKAVAEYGLSPTVGPMSVPTLSAGGGEDSMFGGGGTAVRGGGSITYSLHTRHAPRATCNKNPPPSLGCVSSLTPPVRITFFFSFFFPLQ